MKMKRILVEVPDDASYGRASGAVDRAVGPMLAHGYFADFWGGDESSIVTKGNKVVAFGYGVVSAKTGKWPAQFVLELPAYLVRKGVPAYTGPIKGAK